MEKVVNNQMVSQSAVTMMLIQLLSVADWAGSLGY